jgi:hypothetical protein
MYNKEDEDNDDATARISNCSDDVENTDLTKPHITNIDV